MKYLFQFVLFCLLLTSAKTQPLLTDNKPAIGAANTYAVIIGIAKYLDPDIKALQFSNRDAQLFADFLMSASGGSVPRQHIKLLLDASATTGEVDNALLWLSNNCKAGDNVYFYFSGHGALENETIFQDGYLICYNTPATAFIRMGLSIDRLNKMAATMSNKDVNVVIITDACHSGRLSNSKLRGNLLVGQQLLNATEKEIRMASCTSDQLSIEKADWGGGRGVFSYHLINGLQGGLADKDRNGMVTSGEIKHYVEFKLANDSVLIRDNETQTPVIKGRSDFPLSRVVEQDAALIKKMVAEDSIADVQLSASFAKAGNEESEDPVYDFIELLKKENLAEIIEELPLQNIPDDYLTDFIKDNFLFHIRKEDLPEMRESDIEVKFAPRRVITAKLSALLKSDPQLLERFNIELSRVFNDKGQEMILKYLKGDEAELDQRMYYNSSNKGYEVYARMFEVARRLSKTDQYLSTTSAILQHYFSGVSLRLQIRKTERPGSLIDQALAELNKALALEEHAAYIHNELGILYEYKKNFAEAERNYKKATLLSPNWALPYTNLCGLYAANRLFDKAATACNMADSLQPGFFPVKINGGYLNEVRANYLLAEEIYHEAIEINNRHFAAFERLGYVNMNSMNYAKADSFLYEAAERKKNYHFKANIWDPSDTRASMLAPAPGMTCEFEWRTLQPADVLGNFALAMFEYSSIQDIENAKKHFETVAILDPSNPLVYHYLGKIYYEQQLWHQAERLLKMAVKYHLDDTAIFKYADSVSKKMRFSYDQACFKELFQSYQYTADADYFLLGSVYEYWKRPIDAALCFRTGININRQAIGGYAKLWNLYEREGRYTEAEDVIKEMHVTDSEQSERELSAFYGRMIEKFPDDAWWNYKLGVLLHSRASGASKVPYLDSIVRFPLLKEELFIDKDLFFRLANDSIFALSDNARPDEYDKFRLKYTEFFLKVPGAYIVPGTMENMAAADKILLPRKDGITALTKAAELIADRGTLADIYFRIGNLYQWAGSKKQAYPYLEKSLSFNPDDANVRMAVIDIYRALYKNTDALKHLTYLYDSGQANIDYRLLLARYCILAGHYAMADSLLKQASAIATLENVEIESLGRQLIFLSKKSGEAVKFYKDYLAKNPADWIACYTLARLYAKNGNSNEAFKYLETAIKGGFNYFYVLQNDPYWETIRKNKKWPLMLSRLKPHVYNATAQVN